MLRSALVGLIMLGGACTNIQTRNETDVPSTRVQDDALLEWDRQRSALFTNVAGFYQRETDTIVETIKIVIAFENGGYYHQAVNYLDDPQKPFVENIEQWSTAGEPGCLLLAHFEFNAVGAWDARISDAARHSKKSTWRLCPVDAISKLVHQLVRDDGLVYTRLANLGGE